ncbi:carboxypeptidase-like regulatory domain-containing protein [Sinomicrobium weinanense]|uniref:Carboxypeptidase-like regulatory domain-containing protein n=1 Tax=Sinomicrobium weinanense TaxID=2842200 RepID=A0A926Q3J0_9FLAO|nr:carboxypeptidase-like regulatory domain-containing protein [Sinomicrobium weinanense]MBC9797647.1 carboxypeptidase-like regulatory domain-containing protein [Sinomicrobium weinanense]MBU3122671.1 carboxypeptidase-like regulatory domain-containing protein [Sinomicrobium weinanense]
MQRTRKNKLLLFFLPFSLCGIQAQNTLKGKVESLSSDIEGVHVINKTSETATITDAGGYFEIPVREGDTVLFSAVQFHNEKIAITAEILNTPLFTIHLRPQVTELDEVVLKNLTGNLTTDLRKIKTDSVNAMTLGFPNAHKQPLSQAERKLREATTGGGIVPLNPLINAITGRTKRLKKHVRLEKETEKIEQIRKTIQPHVFTSMGIPGDKVYDFLFYCSKQEDYDHIKNIDDPISLIESLKVKAEQYIKENAPDSLKH